MAPILGFLEWCLHLGLPQLFSPCQLGDFQWCFWVSGVWSSLWLTLVVWQMAVSTSVLVYWIQGTLPPSCLCLCLGFLLVEKVVPFHCDNESVVYILNSHISPAPDFMHRLRSLLMTTATHNFIFTAQHVVGSDNNKIPDAFSHFNWQAFHSLALQADHHPSVIPPHLWERLEQNSLEQNCLALMAQGLAPYTYHTYKSSQLRFANFCSQAGCGSPCPANDWTLC